MDLTKLIIDSRGFLSAFDYDHYPENFEAFFESCRPFFEGLTDKDLQAEANALADSLERAREDLPRRQRQDAADEDKRVIALFLTPAALRFEGDAKTFADILCGIWNDRYHGNTYKITDYETILKGFDKNFLGITLRKSDKKRS